MKTLLTLLKLFILFGRNSLGCFNFPYITYRKLADAKSDERQAIYFLLLSLTYFAFTSLIRSGLRNPYLLTFKFNSLVLGGLSGFFLMIFFLSLMGKIFKTDFNFKKLVALWSYTLLPTLTWFFFTSVMYLILPPPRTMSFFGKIYSIFFIIFSATLLLWKFILYYLTLRFGLKLDLPRIGLSTIFLTPLVILYSILMYRLGVFRIPFL